jgi:hypothetical protein
MLAMFILFFGAECELEEKKGKRKIYDGTLQVEAANPKYLKNSLQVCAKIETSD